MLKSYFISFFHLRSGKSPIKPLPRRGGRGHFFQARLKGDGVGRYREEGLINLVPRAFPSGKSPGDEVGGLFDYLC